MKSKWYLAYLIEFPIIRNKKTLKIIDFEKYLYWDNLVLIKASNPNLAYAKAVKYGREDEYKTINTDGDYLEWKFAGVHELVEIGEHIGDKVELTFNEDYEKSFREIREMIPPKRKLSAFIWNEKLRKEKMMGRNFKKKTDFKLLSKELRENTLKANSMLRNINKNI